MRNWLCAAALAAGITGFVSGAETASPRRFTALGDVPNSLRVVSGWEPFDSVPAAISDDGRVVVGSGAGLFGLYVDAFRWTRETGMIALPEYALREGGPQYRNLALGVSATGDVVVGSSHSCAVSWTAWGGAQSRLKWSGAGDRATLCAISANGDVVAGVSEAGVFRRSAGEGLVYIGSLGATPGADWVSAMSDDGTTIVGSSGGQAFVWNQALGLEPLGSPPGGPGTWSTSTDCSADGSVVVGYSSSSLFRAAFRWTRVGGMAPLGCDSNVPASECYTQAASVSHDGWAIVGLGTVMVDDPYEGVIPAIVPVVWTPATGPVDLFAYAEALGIAGMREWHQLQVIDMSADGGAIVGYAHSSPNMPPSSEDAREGWLLEIPPLARRGDLNCDGQINFADIDPFVLVLGNPGGYAQQFPDCDVHFADLTLDALVDFSDIDAFVTRLVWTAQ